MILFLHVLLFIYLFSFGYFSIDCVWGLTTSQPVWVILCRIILLIVTSDVIICKGYTMFANTLNL